MIVPFGTLHPTNAGICGAMSRVSPDEMVYPNWVGGGCPSFVRGTPEPARAEPQRVLLLHSFGPDFSPWNTITPRFREDLRKLSLHPIDLYEASLQATGR